MLQPPSTNHDAQTTDHPARTPLHPLTAPNPDLLRSPIPRSSPSVHRATRTISQQIPGKRVHSATHLLRTDNHQDRRDRHHGPEEETRRDASAGVVRRDADVEEDEGTCEIEDERWFANEVVEWNDAAEGSATASR